MRLWRKNRSNLKDSIGTRAAILAEDFKMQLTERGFPETEVFWSLGYCQGDSVAFYGKVYPEDLKEKDPQAKEFIEALERSGDVLSIWITGENNPYHHSKFDDR